MSKKIYFISEFYYPVLSSTGYYITEIAEYVASKFENVNVICTNSRYNRNDTTSNDKNEYYNGVRIHRVVNGHVKSNNFIIKALRSFLSSLKLISKILVNIEQGDRVLVVTNPAFLILFFPIIQRIKKFKYGILVHDVFPENLIAIGKLKQNSPSTVLIKKWFNYAYKNADFCISLGRDMTEIIGQKTSGKTKVTTITNWADTDLITPKLKSETLLISKLKLSNYFIFQFAGNLGHAQGLESIIEAIKMVKNKNIHFLFIGSGAFEERIIQLANSADIQNISYVGPLPKSQQNDFLNACDVGIVTLNKNMFGLGVPSKSYNIMAAGKPILAIAEENSEISRCIKENNIGWVVKPGNPALLANTFEQIYIAYTTNSKGISNPRTIAETKYSKSIILSKYEALFE